MENNLGLALVINIDCIYIHILTCLSDSPLKSLPLERCCESFILTNCIFLLFLFINSNLIVMVYLYVII